MTMLEFMNKNKILSGGGKNLTGRGKWGWMGREVGDSGMEVGGKGREVGIWYPLFIPSTTEQPQTSLVAAELKFIGVTLDQACWQLNYRTTANKFDGS